MKLKILIITILLISSCKHINTKKKLIINSGLKEIHNYNPIFKIYSFAEFETLLNQTDNKVYVINFWATWCAPCVKELPHFEKLNTQYRNKGVEVLLVSLDFPHLYEKILKPFIKEKQLKSQVIALNAPDINSWMPKIDTNWSGSIPATVIYNKSIRQFYEQSFNYNTLEKEIQLFLN